MNVYYFEQIDQGILRMLPVCSATTSCSIHSQIYLHGGLSSISSYWRAADVRCNVVERVAPELLNRLQGIYLRKPPAKTLYSSFIEHSELSGSVDVINWCSLSEEVDNNQLELLVSGGSYPTGRINQSFANGTGELKFVANSSVSSGDEKLMELTNQLIDDTDILHTSAYPDSTITVDIIQDDPSLPSDTLDMDTSSLSSIKTVDVDIANETNKSITDFVNKGENALNSSVDTVISWIKSALRDANEALDSVTNELTSTIDRTGEFATNKLSGFSSDLKEASGKIGIVAVDSLRNTIGLVEDSLVKGFTFVVYSYDSLKELLPPEIQDALNVSENKLAELFKPVGPVFQQSYSTLQELERSLGFDPNDPIIPFFLFLGASATIWGSYWILQYGGYAGEFSPQSTLELLKGKENVALIDIRPEDLRERDGIPDLRRAARFRYASIAIPEVDGSVRKLLKGGRSLDDMLIAAVIRNLKIVQDRSKVIIMDSDGSQSKGIARSLRKLGIKNAYLVNGGFQSWLKDGLRIKELSPETTLVILNEEAEAIIEDINPTPLKLFGYGMGLIAATYAAIEWEKTLQFIGVIGIGLTIYRRIASYEDSEDLKQDVRLLLAPVRLGGQAISWAAGKLEPNRNGLPTIPSSLDVQNRVLQAAAKHESQPSDSEENNDPSAEMTAT